jgi:hypothetical protein
MAKKKTKAEKVQLAQDTLNQALQDKVLSSDEIKAINGLNGGVLDTYRAGLLDKVKAGDTDTLRMLGASDLKFAKGIFKDKLLKGTDYYKWGADVLNSAAKDKPIDWTAFPDNLLKIAANLYQGSGDSKLVDPRWIAETNGQNAYLDAVGNPQLTSAGYDAYRSGEYGADNIDTYAQDYYSKNLASLFQNPDGGLNEAGQRRFVEWWRQSGIPDKATAMDKFMQQLDPAYKSQKPAGTSADPSKPTPTMPTDPNDLPGWAAQNILPTTFSPMSKENIAANDAIAAEAAKGIAGGDRNAPIRDLLTNYAKNGGIPDNPYLPTATNVDPTKLAASTAYTVNPYLSDYQTFDMDKFKPTTAAHSDIKTSDGAQINLNDLIKADPGKATAYTSADTQIDPSLYKQATVTPTQVAQMTAAQLDPNTLRMMTPAQFNGQTMANASLMDAGANPYAGKTTGAISFNDANKYAGMNNPYLQSVIDYTTADVARNFNNNIQNSTDAMMARSGAFGGTAWAAAQAENNRQYANELGRTVGGLRMTDYQNQQQLEEARLARALDVLKQNQNIEQQDLVRNADLYSRASEVNANNLTDVSKFNASEGNNIGLKNTEYANDASKTNAGFWNDTLENNTRRLQDASKVNTDARNTAYLQDSGNLYDASKTYTNTWNTGINKNADLLQDNRQWNAGNLTDISNKNADRTQDVNTKFADDWNGALSSNATLKQDNDQWNADAYNTNSENNAARDTTANRNTVNDWNDWNKYNLDTLNTNAKDNASILNTTAADNATRLTNATNKNVDAWNSTLASNAANDTAVSKDRAGTMFDYWNSDWNRRTNAATTATDLPNTVYSDASKLKDVGNDYMNYADKLLGEDKSNYDTAFNYDNVLNGALGNTINAAAGSNNTSTTTNVNPVQNGSLWGNIGGATGILGSLLSAYMNKQPSGGGGGTVGGINPYNSSVYNAANAYLPNPYR